MSFLLIDIGNTFFKWGIYSPPQTDADMASKRVREIGRAHV